MQKLLTPQEVMHRKINQFKLEEIKKAFFAVKQTPKPKAYKKKG